MLKEIRILILEDTETDIYLINRQLKNMEIPFSVDIATNQKEFTDYFQNYLPDIVLSDYSLPDYTGLEALQFVLRLKRNIPLIIITGAINEETAVRCIKAGADDYLTKDNLIRLPSSIISAISNKNNLINKEKAEKALKRSEEKFRTLFEKNEDAIFILRENHFVDCNKSACKLFSYEEKSQIISKHPADLSPEFQIDGEKSENKAEKMIAVALEKGVNKFEWLHKKQTGETFYAEVLLTKIPYKKNYIINSVVRDISAVKKAEGELKQLAIELQTLIKSVNTPIIGLDLNGKIMEWNRAAAELSGKAKIKVIESNFIDTFIHETHVERIHTMINDAINGLTVKNQEILFKSGSGYRELLFNTTTHRNSIGEVIGVILIGQEISDIVHHREELERKIQDRTQELKAALEKERDLGELKSRFVSMASHEFRTPLAAIGFASGFLKKYKDRIDDDTYYKKLDKIEDQISRMTELLDDVLTIGKSDGKLKFNPQKIDLKEFMASISEVVKTATKNSHQIVSNNLCKGITIEMDVKFARNIFINLLTNAIKFSPGKTQIRFENHIQDGQLISKITDFGIGIPEDELEQVFNPFHRARNTDTIQGTGLGLSIVKEAVEVHKGTVLVSSNPGKGTVFTVSLPLEQNNVNRISEME